MNNQSDEVWVRVSMIKEAINEPNPELFYQRMDELHAFLNTFPEQERIQLFTELVPVFQDLKRDVQSSMDLLEEMEADQTKRHQINLAYNNY